MQRNLVNGRNARFLADLLPSLFKWCPNMTVDYKVMEYSVKNINIVKWWQLLAVELHVSAHLVAIVRF